MLQNISLTHHQIKNITIFKLIRIFILNYQDNVVYKGERVVACVFSSFSSLLPFLVFSATPPFDLRGTRNEDRRAIREGRGRTRGAPPKDKYTRDE